MRVRVAFEERYWYPDDGGIVWLAGYSVVDPQTGRFLARDALPDSLRVARVAGAWRHPEALAADAAAPGEPLVLRRDPGNEHDANAIAVDLPDGRPRQPAKVAAQSLPCTPLDHS